MINGIFGDEDALIFEIELIASDGSGLEIESIGSCQKFWCVEKTNRKERKGRKGRIKMHRTPQN